MSESKLRWFRNDKDGVTLMRWVPERNETYSNTTYTYTVPEHWGSLADVFKAKRGERYVVRVVTYERGPGFDQYTARTLREAMRLAKFIVGVKHGS